MVFLIFIQDTFEVRFPLFSSFFTIVAIFTVWKLYVYSKKKSRVKELENYVKYLHWHRLENIKRIKHSLKITKDQIEHITGKVEYADLILDSLGLLCIWTELLYSTCPYEAALLTPYDTKIHSIFSKLQGYTFLGMAYQSIYIS